MKVKFIKSHDGHNHTGWALGANYVKGRLAIGFCCWLLIFDWRKYHDTNTNSNYFSSN